MGETLDGKRKFIIAIGTDGVLAALVSNMIETAVERAQIFTADDGRDLLSKIDNDLPHVVVLRDELAKISGYDAVEQMQRGRAKDVAVIFLNEVPEKLELADQVAIGQYQFVAPAEAATKFPAALSRALNWVSRGDAVDFTLKFLAAGDVLMRQGDIAESVYILKSGHMKAYLPTDEVVTHGVLLGEIEPKEFVGEMAYISGDVRSADVIADTDCELIEIPIPHLDRLLFHKPAWAMALMRTLSKRMKAANLQRADD